MREPDWKSHKTCPDCGEPWSIFEGSTAPCTVLDPFAGAGTTLLVADRLGRHGIGTELNPTYYAMARTRITSDAPLFVNFTDEIKGPDHAEN